jgi:hypothetical protein
MGEFSWTKADIRHTQSANIMNGAPFKCLIPAAYGGGFIKDHYEGHGKLHNGMNATEYDMFELLAFWNHEMPLTEDIISRVSLMGIKPRDTDKTIGDMLRYEGEFTGMKEADANTLRNRRIGILIGTYDDEVDELAYPLKLVSASCKTTYENCDARSYTDPNQGCIKLSWQEYDNCKVHYQQLHLNV